MSELPALVTGAPLAWARDFAIIGGATGGIAPWTVLFDLPVVDDVGTFAVIGATVGAAVGAMLGAGMPTLLDALRSRVRIRYLLCAGPAIGMMWGALAGGAAAIGTGAIGSGHVDEPMFVGFGVVCGAFAGAAQFGLTWFPYTFQTVRRGRTWPIVVASSASAPLMGVFGATAMLATLEWFGDVWHLLK